MKKLSITSFAQHLNNPLNENLYLIHGDERFFFDQLLQSIENRVFSNKADKDLNHHVFYGTEASEGEILSACMSYPMLAKNKLVVVKEFDKMVISDEESFLKYIVSPQSSTILVLLAEKLGRKKFYMDILNAAVSVECKNLRDREVYQWSLDKFKSARIKTDKDSIVFLVENIGLNLLRLNLEIDKIINFLGPEETLTVEKVSQITGFTRDVNIFNFQKVLGSRDLKASIQVGLHLLEQGTAMAAMLPMVFNFFRRMWIVKQLAAKNKTRPQILSEVGGNEYAYRDIFASYNQFSFGHLELIFVKLLEAETFLKSSQKSEPSILTLLIYYICTDKNN